VNSAACGSAAPERQRLGGALNFPADAIVGRDEYAVAPNECQGERFIPNEAFVHESFADKMERFESFRSAGDLALYLGVWWTGDGGAGCTESANAEPHKILPGTGTSSGDGPQSTFLRNKGRRRRLPEEGPAGA